MSTQSSTEISPAPVSVAAEKPVRRVVAKRVPKAAAAAAAAAAEVSGAEATAVPAVPTPETAAAPAPEVDAAPANAKVAKKRAPRKPKAAAVVADAAAPVGDATVAAATVVDAVAQADGDAALGGGAAAAPAVAPVKRVRAPKAPRGVFIVAYGDLDVPEKTRSYTKESFEEWKTQTANAVQNIRYKEWTVAKRKYYQAIKKLNARAKRVTKRLDWEATAKNHLNRLKEMPASDFEALDGTWLSNYQFSGSYDAAYLEKEGCPADKGVVPTYTIYLAALHHGFKPAGIVSENGTRANGNEIVFTTSVDGRREYVGVALPFQSKERSKYSVIPADRVPSEVVA